MTGCLYVDAAVAELFVLLPLPQPFDAARIATAVKRGGEIQVRLEAGVDVAFPERDENNWKGEEHWGNKKGLKHIKTMHSQTAPVAQKVACWGLLNDSWQTSELLLCPTSLNCSNSAT